MDVIELYRRVGGERQLDGLGLLGVILVLRDGLQIRAGGEEDPVEQLEELIERDQADDTGDSHADRQTERTGPDSPPGPRPIEAPEGIRFASQMSVTLSCDHRVVDGALGAELLAAFKLFFEHPVGMMI